MIVAQPGLTAAPGVSHGPTRWRGNDLSEDERQAVDRARSAPSRSALPPGPTALEPNGF